MFHLMSIDTIAPYNLIFLW